MKIAILFGPRATNSHMPKSDYDFAVLGNKDIPPWERWNERKFCETFDSI